MRPSLCRLNQLTHFNSQVGRRSIGVVLLFLFLFPCFSLAASALEPKAADLVENNQIINLSSAKYQALFDELVESHGFDRQYLQQLYSGVTINKKVLQLIDTPWEAKPYYLYRPRFITPITIADGKTQLQKFRNLFEQIEKTFGVNREYIVAIWAVESRYGVHQGTFNVFRSLNTLFDAYPRRSDFFGKELIAFTRLCRDNKLNPKNINGSYAGAFGQAQFMPSSYLNYAVDFDGDKSIDLINSHADIFASIAHYLLKSGWVLDSPVYAEIGNSLNSDSLKLVYEAGRKARVDWRLTAKTQDIDLPRPPSGGKLSIVGLEPDSQPSGEMRYIAGYPNFQAIMQYNHSHKYAMVVAELAQAYQK